jgi:hypothetical protein
LISAGATVAAPSARRVMVAPPPGASEIEVHITRISTTGCLMAELASAFTDGGAAWLKLPGRAPIRIFAHPTDGGALACKFAQPLYPSELESLLRRERPRAQVSQVRARCTFLAP